MKSNSRTQIIKNNDGFTIIEVMIALSIFSIFLAAFALTQSYNLNDSMIFKEELILRNFALLKFNELTVDPPDFTDALTLAPEKKGFKDNEDYTYSVAYKKFPDISKFLTAGQGNEEDTEQEENPFLKKVAVIYKDNLEKFIWQVEVTVINKLTDRRYTISGYLYNHKAEVKFNSL